LKRRFEIDPTRIIIVPGNHDLNWDQSREAYAFKYKHKLPDPLPEGRYIPAGEPGVLLCEENLYKQRFVNFSHFYQDVCGTSYPLNCAEQGILHLFPDNRILFLTLNSCWEIDHHYRQRASINSDALTFALDQLQGDQYNDWLKIAVWHHSVTGREMMDDEFLERLESNGFRICMHGHIHKAIEGYHKYDAHRGLYIIGAGTFGAPTRQWTPGIPLQYNLLAFDPAAQIITVMTRKREKPDGAWGPDPRWGSRENPESSYQIELYRTMLSPGYTIAKSQPYQVETV
jgi:hypothetical protein